MKYLKVISLFLVVLFLCGCSNSDSKYLKKIDYKEFKKMLDDEKTFFVEVIQTGCSACASFTPKLEDVLEEYKIKAYQLNITDMAEKDYEEFDAEYSISGTPEVIFLTGGKEESKLQRITQNIAKSKIIAKLQANGYIEEEGEETKPESKEDTNGEDNTVEE